MAKLVSISIFARIKVEMQLTIFADPFADAIAGVFPDAFEDTFVNYLSNNIKYENLQLHSRVHEFMLSWPLTSISLRMR